MMSDDDLCIVSVGIILWSMVVLTCVSGRFIQGSELPGNIDS